MKLYIKRTGTSPINAVAEYNVDLKEFTVLEGSIISENISHSEKFRGAGSIEKARNGIVKDNKVIKDITFKSASTAANFVTGTSTNGLIAWKNADGKVLKQILSEMEAGNE